MENNLVHEQLKAAILNDIKTNALTWTKAMAKNYNCGGHSTRTVHKVCKYGICSVAPITVKRLCIFFGIGFDKSDYDKYRIFNPPKAVENE